MSWADIVVGFWLGWAAYEDSKNKVIDLGVPLAIVLTRLACEGPGWIIPGLKMVLPFFAFMKVLEVIHLFGLLRGRPVEPVWGEGDTYLLTSVALYLGLNTTQAFTFMAGSIILMYVAVALVGIAKGDLIRRIQEGTPLSPGVFAMYVLTKVWGV